MAKKILLPIDHTDENSWKLALPAALEQAKFYDAELATRFGKRVIVEPSWWHKTQFNLNWLRHAA